MAKVVQPGKSVQWQNDKGSKTRQKEGTEMTACGLQTTAKRSDIEKRTKGLEIARKGSKGWTNKAYSRCGCGCKWKKEKKQAEAARNQVGPVEAGRHVRSAGSEGNRKTRMSTGSRAARQEHGAGPRAAPTQPANITTLHIQARNDERQNMARGAFELGPFS